MQQQQEDTLRYPRWFSTLIKSDLLPSVALGQRKEFLTYKPSPEDPPSHPYWVYPSPSGSPGPTCHTMSARCFMCHCYSRNCPTGLPNHKNVLAGPSCNNNTLDRHYRVHNYTTVPMCDFVRCTFFSSDANRDLSYLADVSLGPVTVSVSIFRIIFLLFSLQK